MKYTVSWFIDPTPWAGPRDQDWLLGQATQICNLINLRCLKVTHEEKLETKTVPKIFGSGTKEVTKKRGIEYTIHIEGTEAEAKTLSALCSSWVQGSQAKKCPC